jgi:hypothetical protein
LLIALSAALVSGCSGPERVIGLRETIHHDDFEYSVQSATRLARIGDRLPSGTFYVVTFQVANHAKAVDHRWGDDVAYVVDERGREYEVDRLAQEELARLDRADAPAQHVTHAGTLEHARLVFDLPPDAAEPYLKVRGWTLMGDVFDGWQFRRVRVRLF